jgi:5'-nucleotidase
VSTAKKYAQVLQRQGVKSIVVLLHQGGIPADGAYNYDCNAGGNLGLTGDVVDIAKQITPKVDLILTGHTHTAYVCNIPDPDGNSRMVTSAASFGRLFTDVDMTVNKASGDVVRTSVSAVNKAVTRDVAPDADENALIAEYNTLIAPIRDRVIGRIGGTIFGRGCGAAGACPTGESPAGDLIADAQLEGVKTDPLNSGGADFAIMNPGGIRADFTCPPPGTDPCDVTYGAAFNVQPFTNIMNVIAMSGADVITMFGQQWVGQGTNAKTLQISSNVHQVVRSTGALNENRLVSLTIDGQPVDPAKTYRVAMNEFLGGGGDGFTAIRNGTKVFVGGSDLDVLVAYLGAHSSSSSPYPVPTVPTRTTFGS